MAANEPLDLDAIKANDYRPDRNGAAAYRQSDLAAEDVPVLIAEVEKLRRGGKELGKIIDFMGDLIKDAYLRGAHDPIGALNMLGNCLAEMLESEGGLSAAEFSRVQRVLDARESEEETRLREGDERRRAEVSRSLADMAHAQRPLTEPERVFQDGV